MLTVRLRKALGGFRSCRGPGSPESCRRQRGRGRLRSSATGVLGSNGRLQATWPSATRLPVTAVACGGAGERGDDGAEATVALGRDGERESRAREARERVAGGEEDQGERPGLALIRGYLPRSRWRAVGGAVRLGPRRRRHGGEGAGRRGPQWAGPTLGRDR
jgi:hypothetical protein